MEYVQELDKIKTEIENSGKKLEDLSESIQNLSGLSKLQESITNFQEDNVLNRIETKIDILAQTDYSDLFNFSIDSLKEDLAKKIESVTDNPDAELIKNKINYISTKLNDYNESVENRLNDKDSLLEDLAFLKENFYKINEKFSEITHLIRTNTAESEELNNRFENNLTNFNSGFQNIYERFNHLDNTFNNSFADFKTCINDIYDQFSTIDSRTELDQIKFYVQSFSNKIISISEILEELKRNNFSIKIDSREELQEIHKINNKISSVLDETQCFSNKISDEFSSLVNPLSSAIELTCNLKESIDELLAQDNVQVQKEAVQLLNKFENIYKNAETNFEYIFTASKQFYEKLEETKNEFSNISYDTNSKINDFISKTDTIDLKIQNSLSNSETAINSIRNISAFAENQINLTSENLHILKTGVAGLSEDFSSLKNAISDISSKINKVILNEKENSNSLNSSFNDLKEEINKNYEANIENLNEAGEKIVKKLSDELKNISKKIEKTEEISSTALEKSEDVKSALVYMAEWFDTAGKLIEENNQHLKKNSIEKVDFFIKRTEENVVEQLKRVSDKLNRLEVRMENIEGRVEKVQDQHSNKEILNLLSDILEKVELSNERSKSNELLASRLENLESKIEEIEEKKTAKSKKRLAEEKV